MKITPTALFVTLASAAVLFAVVAGLAIIGPPTQVRMYRLDEQRVADLRNISNAIELYRNAHSVLPDTLDKLQKDPLTQYLHVNDPESNLPYEYELKSATSYELCTRFAASSQSNSERIGDIPKFWNHKAGRQCFSLETNGQAQH